MTRNRLPPIQEAVIVPILSAIPWRIPTPKGQLGKFIRFFTRLREIEPPVCLPELKE